MHKLEKLFYMMKGMWLIIIHCLNYWSVLISNCFLFLFLSNNKLHNLSSTFGEGNGTLLQYSCLENPMDGGAWCTAVHGSDTTEWLHFHFSLSCVGEGNGNPLQCSCLENPRDGGAWWAAVYGVAQSRTRLKRLSSSCSSYRICLIRM